MTPNVKYGNHAVRYLPTLLEQTGARNIFLVTGKASYSASGASDKIDDLLRAYSVHRFSDFSTNPKVEDLERGIDELKQHASDAIVAIGGGSILDMAKLINAFHESTRPCGDQILAGESGTPGIPLIAIPTTAGSGSEATHFAVVYVDQKKYSVAGNHILPKQVLIDPDFTYSASAYLTAVTGLDALAQAMESFWSVHSTDESKAYSRDAITLIWKHLNQAVHANNKEAKNRLAWASHLAGKAINIAKTTAAHALSYSFTTYFNIPHGHAVALSLPYFLEYNYLVTPESCNDKRGVNYVRATLEELLTLLSCSDVHDAPKVMQEFIQELGLETRLDELGITSQEVEHYIIGNINAERMSNNPRKVDTRHLFHSLTHTTP